MSEPENPTENPKLGVGRNPTLVPGNPGNSGGKKGRSGRTPDWFKEFCRTMVTSPKAQAAARQILGNPKHQQFTALWKAVSERGYGKPDQAVTGPDGGPIQHAVTVYIPANGR